MARPNSQQTVRLLILGLPAGLVLSGIIAMFVYFRVDKARQAEETRVPVRKPVTESDLRSHVRTLATAVGPRHAGAPGSLSSAAKYIQSTLGPANLGFRVSRQEVPFEGQELHNLIIDVPGAPGPRAAEMVLVTANYDSAPGSPGADGNATGMAALMSLAQSFAGEAPPRTLRFAALVNAGSPGTPGGAAAYAARLRAHRDEVVAAVCLEGLGYYTDAAQSQRQPAAPAVSFPAEGNFLAVVASGPPVSPLLERLAAEARTAARLPLVMSSAAETRGLPVPGSTAAVLQSEGWPVLLVTDTGALRHPHWGQAGDTLETVDFPRLVEAVRCTEAIVRTLLAEPSLKTAGAGTGASSGAGTETAGGR